MTWRYRIYGLEIESGIDLGALCPGDERCAADVIIERGDVAEVHDGWLSEDDDGLILDCAPAARMLISGGKRIVIDGDLAGLAALRWRLLGVGFGTLLHQRGIMPLHATLVDIAGRAVALTGISGSGKSTLAAWLAAAGHTILVDDVCALSTTRDGKPVTEPGHGRMRLCADTAARLGLSGGEMVDESRGKYEFPSGPVAPVQREIAALVELRVGNTLSLTKVPPPEALGLFLRHTYLSQVLEHTGKEARNFVQCAALAKAVPAFKFARPLDLSIMDQSVALMETLP